MTTTSLDLRTLIVAICNASKITREEVARRYRVSVGMIPATASARVKVTLKDAIGRFAS